MEVPSAGLVSALPSEMANQRKKIPMIVATAARIRRRRCTRDFDQRALRTRPIEGEAGVCAANSSRGALSTSGPRMEGPVLGRSFPAAARCRRRRDSARAPDGASGVRKPPPRARTDRRVCPHRSTPRDGTLTRGQFNFGNEDFELDPDHHLSEAGRRWNARSAQSCLGPDPCRREYGRTLTLT